MTSSPSDHGELPVHLTLELARAAADMQRLLLLDRVWTEAAESGADLSDQDREALHALGNDIYDQFGIIERHAYSLRQIFNSYPEWVNARIRSALYGEHFTGSQREDALSKLEVTGEDFAGRGVALADLLTRRVTVEREDLRRKLPAFRGSGPAEADSALETGCALAGVTVMVDLLLCPETLGIGCVVAIVVLAEMGPCPHG